MKSVILIKNNKKYKIFVSWVTLNKIFLTGYDSISSNDEEINPHNLVKKTCSLGKSIYDVIKENNYDKNSDSNLIMEAMDPKDIKNQKKVIKNYIEDFKKIENKNQSHYAFMFKFYKKSFYLLKEHGFIKKITGEMLPVKVNEYINKATNNFYEWFELDKETLIKLEKIYNDFFTIVKNNLDALELDILIQEISYIPFNIDNFYENIYINGNGKNNQSSINIFNSIEKWCKEFGMPFWTNRTKIAEYTKDLITTTGEITSEWTYNSHKNTPTKSYSKYEYANNTVPINGLISISLIIYLFYSIWEEYHSTKKLSIEKQRELKFLKTIIGFVDVDNYDYEYNYDYEDNIENLIELGYKYHNYIIDKFNYIGDLKLCINDKKICKKTGNGFTYFCNIREYESSAIAAWDIFYHDYLGNTDISKPLPYCEQCHNEISKNPHYTAENKILCNKCFKLRKKELGRIRTQKYRNKEKNNK